MNTQINVQEMTEELFRYYLSNHSNCIDAPKLLLLIIFTYYIFYMTQIRCKITKIYSNVISLFSKRIKIKFNVQ